MSKRFCNCSGAAQADGAAALALQVGPAANQARGHVLELGQLDLQLAFVAVRAQGEDVEDQPGAVDDAALQRLFQVAFLDRAQRMVDQHQVGAGRLAGRLHFLELAAADQEGRVGLVDPGIELGGDGGARRPRQVGEFLGQPLVGRTAGVGLDQEGGFAPAGSFEHRPRMGATGQRFNRTGSYSFSSAPPGSPSSSPFADWT